MRVRLRLRWLLRFQVQRYRTPSLHEGVWSTPDVRHGVVRWYRVDGDGWIRSYVSAPHPHVTFVCTIGPGMAHVDECLCGARRYGVFGAWS
jgi:hypothetical protein